MLTISTFPVVPAPSRVRWTLGVLAAISDSEFTHDDQAFPYAGERLEVDVTMPPMTRQKGGAAFAGFLAGMRGVSGLCSFGPRYQGSWGPLGIGTGVPKVNGAGQVGSTLATNGWTHSITGILLTGDFIQVQGANYYHLHILTADANSDSSGNASLKLFPRIRDAANGSNIVLTNPIGTFRLADNTPSFDIDSALKFGIGVKLIEKVSIA